MKTFIPSQDTLEKLRFINLIQDDAKKEGFKLWHCGSWAITAMLGFFFKDLKDIDIVVKTEADKKKLSAIVEKHGFRFMEEHPWGPNEYTNGNYEIEFGSAEDKRNMYFEADFNNGNYGYINDIKLYIADPQKILQSRYDMIKAGYKKDDETQRFIIETVKNFINSHKKLRKCTALPAMHL